jgi:hypothetical protein
MAQFLSCLHRTVSTRALAYAALPFWYGEARMTRTELLETLAG